MRPRSTTMCATGRRTAAALAVGFSLSFCASAHATTVGTKYPGTVTTAADAAKGFDDLDWTGTELIKSSGAGASNGPLQNAQFSYVVYATNFGFAIPTGANMGIDGITVRMQGHDLSGSAVLCYARLVTNGVYRGENKGTDQDFWTGNDDCNIELGLNTDTWGTNWTPEMINDPGFGVAFAVKAQANNTTTIVDFVRMSVTYSPIGSIDDNLAYPEYQYNPSPDTVFVSDQIGYAFYVCNYGGGAPGNIAYRKTTDGGEKWQQTVCLTGTGYAGQWYSPAVWYDRWTPGEFGGNTIHIACISDSHSLCYMSQDTADNDKVSRRVEIVVGTGYSAGSDGNCSITKSTKGDLFVWCAFEVGSVSRGMVFRSTNNGATWTEIMGVAEGLDARNDHAQILPLSGGDILLIHHDISANVVHSKVWDADSETWDGSWTTIDTWANNGNFDVAWGASLHRASNTVYLVGNPSPGDSSLVKAYKFTDSGRTWSMISTVLADVEPQVVGQANLLIDDNNGDLYCVYSRGNGASDVSIYFKKSTDFGETWSAESSPINTVFTNDYRWVRGNLTSDERLFATWYDISGNGSLFGATITNLTSSRPSISNDSVGNVTVTSASVCGYLSSTGGAATHVWAYWGTSDGGTVKTNWQTIVDLGTPSSTGGVTTSLSTLTADKTYYYRFYASNAYGQAWASSSDSFATSIDASAYPCKMKITFTGYNKTETLLNFPALVILNEGLANLRYNQFASTNGYDLRFMDESQSQALNYEIETWATNTNSYVWVQVPLFTNNCSIWAYWGNEDATNPAVYTTNGATWDTQYQGVWHLKESPGAAAPQIRDSTRYFNHGNCSNGMTSANSTNGLMGRGLYFDGATNLVDLGKTSRVSLHTYYECVVSFWYKSAADTDSKEGKPYSHGPQNGTTVYFRFNDSNPETIKWRTVQISTGSDEIWTKSDIQNQEWRHYAAVRKDGKKRVYVDGVMENEVEDGTRGIIEPGSNDWAYIGGRWGETVATYGTLDEMRVTDHGHSSARVWASYMTEKPNSGFSTYGIVDGPPWIDNAGGATNVTTSSAWLNGTLLSTGTAATAVWVYWGDNNGGTVKGDWDTNRYFGVNSAACPVPYTTNVTGLASETTYYYRYYASNAIGDVWTTSAAVLETGSVPPVPPPKGTVFRMR